MNYITIIIIIVTIIITPSLSLLTLSLSIPCHLGSRWNPWSWSSFPLPHLNIQSTMFLNTNTLLITNYTATNLNNKPILSHISFTPPPHDRRHPAGGYGEPDIAYAYRQLSRALHPDKNREVPEAHDAFQRLSEAADELRQGLADQRKARCPCVFATLTSHRLRPFGLKFPWGASRI